MKLNICHNSFFHIFIKGILFSFFMDENPLAELRKNRKSDADKIRSDWENVGNDIYRAYEKCKGA